MQAFVIRQRWALGDAVVLSALPRDIALTYPGKYRISFAGHYESMWKNNPHVQPLDPKLNARVLHFEYISGIKGARHNKSHFISHFHKQFELHTGAKVPVLFPHGDIHLSATERKRQIKGRYWVVVAGGKIDMTAKWWSYARYQEVVNELAANGIRCVQAGANFTDHVHPGLTNCINTIGSTDDIRDLFGLIYHADGVICGITGAMHIAAAFNKPCVCIAGGREEPWWEAYVNFPVSSFGPQCAPVKVPHRFLHTVGLLDCGFGRDACWANRVVPIDDQDLKDQKRKAKLCTKPLRNPDQTVPKCMDMITVQHVVDAVMSYYENGTLLPATESYPLPVTKPNEIFIPPPELREVALTENRKFRIVDHPYIGGKFTLFILAYGDYPHLLKGCLESILASVPPRRLDIRIALNQPGEATLKYVAELPAGLITKVYPDHGTRRKYEAMREMFHDTECPIKTKYLLWFDDDAKIANPRWIFDLSETIVSNHLHGARMFGRVMHHDLKGFNKNGHRPDLWFKDAAWWRGQDLRLSSGDRTGPNGSRIDFVTGWFWALDVAAMREAMIPDVRLKHNGGDCTIGEQIHQAGFRLMDFNRDKKYVWCPPKINPDGDSGRRGFSEAFPWADPATRANHVSGT